jgi:hypothetical protein
MTFLNDEMLERHFAMMREATKLKENGNLKGAIDMIRKSHKETGRLDHEKLASYLSRNGDVDIAVSVLKDAMNKELPYNNHSYLWNRIASIYYRNGRLDDYIFAASMSLFFFVVHHTPVVPGGKELFDGFYRRNSPTEYIGITNFNRYLKKINKPDFGKRYNETLMTFFNEIKPSVSSIKYDTKTDMLTEIGTRIAKQYSTAFFTDIYNKRIAPLI